MRDFDPIPPHRLTRRDSPPSRLTSLPSGLRAIPSDQLSRGDLIVGSADDQGDDQPTLPSSVIPNSCCASSANSIGSSLNTSLQKPLTIIDTACSADRPRCFR
jgi:hypothetical protein